MTLCSNALPHAVTVKSACCQTALGCQSSCIFDKVWEGFGGDWRQHFYPWTLQRAIVPGQIGGARVVWSCMRIVKPQSVPMLML